MFRTALTAVLVLSITGACFALRLVPTAATALALLCLELPERRIGKQE